MKKWAAILFGLVILFSVTASVALAADSVQTAKQISALVKNAKEDIEISLQQDIEFSSKQPLSNNNGITVRILGNGCKIKGALCLGNGRYELENAAFESILVNPAKGETTLVLDENCIGIAKIPLAVRQKASGSVNIVNNGRLIGWNVGLVSLAPNVELTLQNNGSILGAWGLWAADEKAKKGQTLTVENNGEIRGMFWAAAELMANHPDTEIRIIGTGRLIGGMGALVGGQGKIELDQQIQARSYGTLHEQEKWPEFYQINGENAQDILAYITAPSGSEDLYFAYAKEYGITEELLDQNLVDSVGIQGEFVNGYAVVDMGSVHRIGLANGFYTKENKSLHFRSPTLTVKGSIQAQNGALYDLWIPRETPLTVESNVEQADKPLRVIYAAEQSADSHELYEQVQIELETIRLGGLESDAMATILIPGEKVFSLSQAPCTHTFGGALNAPETWQHSYESAYPLKGDRWKGWRLNRTILEMPNDSILLFEEDGKVDEWGGEVIKRVAKNVTLEGQGHSFDGDHNFCLAPRSSLTIRNFERFQNWKIVGGETVFENCAISGDINLTDGWADTSKKTKVSIINSDIAGPMYVSAGNKADVEMHLDGASQTDGEYLWLAAEKGGSVTVENNGSALGNMIIRMQGGNIAYHSESGTLKGVDVWNEGGGKLVFRGDADNLNVNAEAGKLNVTIGGNVYAVLCFDAQTAKTCKVKFENEQATPTIRIKDLNCPAGLDETSIHKYLKKALPPLTISAAYVVVENAEGTCYSDHVDFDR